MENEIEIKLKSQEELATTIFELNIEKFKLNEQLQQYKQQIDEVKKDLQQFLEEWDEDDYVSKSINLILSKLKEGDEK